MSGLKLALKIAGYVLFFTVTVLLLVMLACGSGGAEVYTGSVQTNVEMMERFDKSLTNQLSDAMEGVLSIEKVFWLCDDDKVAPLPDQAKFGVTGDPTSLGWLMEEAQDILEGQETTFHPNINIAPWTKVHYYLDETIFAVTWKQAFNGGIYCISEVKIKHPSQLRRFLSGGEYGSGVLQTTTQMSDIVNAVVASSGDYYAFRQQGVIVYDGVVQRVNSRYIQTCYIDDQGDMLFSYAGQLPDKRTAQEFVDANNIRFSLAFGPVLVDNGKYVHTYDYLIGEVLDEYARAAFCQKDKLHYLVVTLNTEGGYRCVDNLEGFGRVIESFGVQKAYTLDGGQTGAIVMNDKLINSVRGGSQRYISDIFYFATAVPNGQ